MSKIEYATKTSARTNTTPDSQKVTADNMNEIKASVNALYDGEGGLYLSATKLITSAELLAGNTSPIQLVAAPGANKLAVPLQLNAFLDYGGTAYATNTRINLLRGTSLISFVSGALAVTQDAIIEMGGLVQAARTPAIDHIDQGIFLGVDTGDPINGNSPIQAHLSYMIVDFSLIT